LSFEEEKRGLIPLFTKSFISSLFVAKKNVSFDQKILRTFFSFEN
jgi:hypothetical protein